MKTIIKTGLLALLLCIGYIPTSTGASFEPAKAVLCLGDDNPGNYSLLQYAIQHGSNQEKNTYQQDGIHSNTNIIDGTTQPQNHDVILLHQLMKNTHSYRVPFRFIILLFSQLDPVLKNQ